MKRLNSKITIGEWTFDFVTDIEIVSSWDLLTDTCNIDIPKNIIFKRDNKEIKNIIEGDNPIFVRGDNVVVKLGYDLNLKTVFIGRLSDVNPARPMTLMCQDDMYLLKQESFIDETVNLKNTTLKELIDTVFAFGSASFVSERIIADIEIGDIQFKDTAVAKVLDYLRKRLGIVSYFRITGDESVAFVSGLPYGTEDNFIVGEILNEDKVITFAQQQSNGPQN